MSKALVKSAFTVGLLIILMAVPVYGASVNKSIKVAAGSESDGATTVNGSISVGEGAVVTGTLKTVNGKIRVDENTTIEDAVTVNGSLGIADGVKADNLSTVNGSVSVGEDCTVDGEIGTVNGRIKLEKGSKVAQDVGNVNGDIELAGSEVGGNVKTVSGNVDLSEAAVIKGDLIIEEPSMWSFGNKSSRVPEVVIGPGSAVEGTIRLEREVKLYISESAKVGGVEGEMSMSDAVRFSGDHP
ncbi:MAG: hypothetical protein OEU90_13410 [Gammaproteobacteria bacterium]|jgi:DUF4097 and DUF4098 domain-containing protein YvlB|nr:hypothetical protein [Gammaproteobacteria bacterium]MDH3751476.1 hypothetical protein [Gammaproteobacteria bacterium]MDH3806453.1 hypothetical protein [Gammaproteobacteria bacterium]